MGNLKPGITVVIPSIPVRDEELVRAAESAEAQTLRPVDILIETDHERVGAALNRDRGLARVGTEWVAFLDDDDELYPQHLERLLETALRTGADLVYPWYDVKGGTDPFPQWEGVPWSNDATHQVPITVLARTEAIRAVGGYSYAWDPSQGTDPGLDPDGNRAGEDYRLILRMVARGLKIVHHNERTWAWHHHGLGAPGVPGNTSGLPSRW